MTGPEAILNGIDSGLTSLLASWNSFTTGLATALLTILVYRLWSAQDPDAHPLELARQAVHSGIRMPGQSPIFAAHYDANLITGLNVRARGASSWAKGRDGDLRDVWRQALTGASPAGAALRTPAKGDVEVENRKGRLMTVLGKQLVDHDLDQITRQILLVGQHLASQGSSKVAIHLPNSIELLIALFACAFQPSTLSPILIPFGVSPIALASMIHRSEADAVITIPGAFPLETVVESSPHLRHIVWLANEGNKHLDWDDIASEVGDNVGARTWESIVEKPLPEGLTLNDDTGLSPQDITIFWPTKDHQLEELVRFSHANVVCGIAGQLAAISSMGPDDIFLPADTLTHMHTLVLTLAALFSNASIVLDAAASQNPDLLLAKPMMARAIFPTIIVATPETLRKAQTEYENKRQNFLLERLMHWRKDRMLRQGCMPTGSTAAASPNSAGGPRLIVTADRAGSGMTPPLTQAILSDLRAATGSQIVYAMTAASVAGAVTQTKAFDYRVEQDGNVIHFGGPLRGIKYFLLDTDDKKSRDNVYEGEICVQGPCVIGGESRLGVIGKVRPDNTLTYV